jgi:membrane-bound lytic murein transglycosylase B
MNRQTASPFLLFAITLIFIFPQSVFSATPDDFSSWLADLRKEATSLGITEKTLDEALTDLHPIERVLELDRKQPEFTLTFWKYLDGRVTDQRVERGKKLLKEHAALLKSIERQFGVQPRFLVAFWGLETNFGDYLGGFPVIGSLATLAFDPRRSSFFRNELFAALQILNEGHISPAEMKGSWAGAMGQPQFMPSTFIQNAVDQDNDGRKDIWNSLPDVFGSAANYLSRSGWDGKRTWGREILLPENFDISLAGLKNKKKLKEWQKLGIRRIDGRDLPAVDISASLFMPAGFSGPAFLVYSNYHVILKWNRSHLYAIAVGHLADRLVDGRPLQSKRPLHEKPLRRTELEEIQKKLTELGFDAGPVDGVIGSQTRTALKHFQTAAGVPADGYPTFEMLEKLRNY